MQLRSELGLATLTAKLADLQFEGVCLPAHVHVLLSLGAGLPRVPMSVAALCTQEDLAIVLAAKNPLRNSPPAAAESGALKFGLLTPGSPARLLVQRWLQLDFKAARVSPTFVPLAAGQLVDFLAEGVIDGFCGIEPAPAIAAASGIGERVVHSGALFPGHPGGAVALRRDFAQQHPGRLESLGRALHRAREFCANPANAAEVWKLVLTHSPGLRASAEQSAPEAPAPWFRVATAKLDSLLDAAGIDFVVQACTAAIGDPPRGADLKAEVSRVFRLALPVAAGRQR